MKVWWSALVVAQLLGPAEDRTTKAGNDAYSEGELDEALKNYTQAQVEHPDALELHYNIGNVQFRKDDLDKAFEEPKPVEPQQIAPGRLGMHLHVEGLTAEVRLPAPDRVLVPEPVGHIDLPGKVAKPILNEMPELVSDAAPPRTQTSDTPKSTPNRFHHDLPGGKRSEEPTASADATPGATSLRPIPVQPRRRP